MESKLYKRKKELDKKEFIIIGSSDYGPTNAIVQIENENDVLSVFGKEGTLYNSYNQIKNSIPKNVNVNMIKTCGTHAYAYFNLNCINGEVGTNSLILSSIYSNEIYNDTIIAIDDEKITFKFHKELMLEDVNYYYSDYEIVGQLVDAINTDTYNSKNIVIANSIINEYTPFDSSFYVINESTTMSGGSNGLNCSNTELYKCLNYTYDILQGENIHLISLSNAFVDDEVDDIENNKVNFYNQLLEFSIKQLRFGIVTIGFITFSDRVEYGEYIESHIKSLLNKVKINNSTQELQFLISIVYGDIYYDYMKSYSNPLMFYSSLYLNLQPGSNTTNKSIDDSYHIKDHLTQSQIKELSELGVVTFRHSPYYDKVVACNGVTSVTLQSEFKYIVNVSMVQTIMPVIKSELESYLGEDIKAVIESNAVKESVKKTLVDFANKEIIDKYDFNLEANYEKGELVCKLNLKSSYMVEDIEIIGKINFEQLGEV